MTRRNVLATVTVQVRDDSCATYVRDISEAEFRKLFAATLAAIAAFAPDKLMPGMPQMMSRVAEYLDGDQPIGDPEYDYSLLGTFLTVGQMIPPEATGGEA